MGVPSDKTQTVLDIIKQNGKFLGVIKEIKGSQYVHVESPKISPTEEEEEEIEDNEIEESKVANKEQELPAELLSKLNIQPPKKDEKPEPSKSQDKPKIFITHGKNKQVVNQLKELLTFGQFEAVVSVEKETTAIPVPDKVFEDMRNCQGAVIHVENENELLDKDGKTVHMLNSNVLIEIGAAMALYGKNFILLCQKEVKLPSNLQGLYRCNYEGEGLDYQATMKLLKAFNEIRSNNL